MTLVAGTTFLSTRPIGAGRGKQIDLLTVFDSLPRVVSPADALGNRARSLEREVRASGRHKKAQ
jgi:hypothetical protein